MTSAPRIVGISLVRNEDRFVDRALRNVLDFCDELHVVDHASTDGTPAILDRLARDAPHVSVVRTDDPRTSHDLIAPYAGRPVWVFGVDGDELYEPERLDRLRARLIAGEFDRWWTVFGHVLHCTALDVDAGIARGHLAPPARSMTKLYNFAAIDEWAGAVPQRLHGGTPRFREGYSADRRLAVFHEIDWEATPFRCLHLCFVPRSSLDRAGRSRRNVSESQRAGVLASAYSALRGSRWKQRKYRTGPIVEQRVDGFLRPAPLQVRAAP